MPLASSVLCLVLRCSDSNGRSSNVPTYQAQYVQLFKNPAPWRTDDVSEGSNHLFDIQSLYRYKATSPCASSMIYQLPPRHPSSRNKLNDMSEHDISCLFGTHIRNINLDSMLMVIEPEYWGRIYLLSELQKQVNISNLAMFQSLQAC